MMKLTLSFYSIIFSLISLVISAYSNDELLSMVLKKGSVLTLTDKNYHLFLDGPRDYHVVLLLSSQSPQFKCPLCYEFKPEYEMVADSWYKDHPNGIGNKEGKDIFFFYSEFLQAKEFFTKLKLNNIPKSFYIKPSTVSTSEAWVNELDEYQFFQGKHSELIMEWLRSITDHKFNLYVPINYKKIIVNAVITFLITIMAIVFRKQFINFFTSKMLWTGASILLILLFNSGYMFNQIRQSPYVKEHPDGRIDYWVQGQQSQYGIETQIVSFMYGALSLCVLLLIKQVPKIQHPHVKLIAATFVTITIFLAYSALLNFFGMKSPGYPFRFIKFIK